MKKPGSPEGGGDWPPSGRVWAAGPRCWL